MAVGFGIIRKVSNADGIHSRGRARHFSGTTTSNALVAFVSHNSLIVEIDCYKVRRELSNYLDGDLTLELRRQVENHLASCSHCTAVYDGMRNVVTLLGDERVIELPEGFSRRLYQFVAAGAPPRE